MHVGYNDVFQLQGRDPRCVLEAINKLVINFMGVTPGMEKSIL